MTRIALIHALEESVGPARDAFAELWPEAYAFDLLDTSLAVDRALSAEAGRELDESMFARFRTLADYAASTAGKGGRTAGILFTCSAFGPAIEAVKHTVDVPVLKPNEAAFATALELGERIGLVVSFEPSRASLEEELLDMAAVRNRSVTVLSARAAGALAALKSGDTALHDSLVAQAAVDLGDVDVIVLGQFSLARAKPEVARLCGRPVVTTPESAVRELRRLTG